MTQEKEKKSTSKGNFFKNFMNHFKSKNVAIDLGTVNTLIYSKDEGIVLNEPSIVAVINENGYEIPYLFGKEASCMVGKTPNKIKIRKPLSKGVIGDFAIAEAMIKHFISKFCKINSIFKPSIVICVPLDSTPVERRSIQESAYQAGAKEVLLIEEPMAAAIGVELPINGPTGSMIIDIGGGTTEVALISLGGVVIGKSIQIGGNIMDESIITYIRKKYNLLIGNVTAEKIKHTIGSVSILNEKDELKKMNIRGRDLIAGNPKEITINSYDIVAALSESISKIIEGVSEILESAPPELASDVVENGIVLTGGGSKLDNLDYILQQSTGISVYKAKDPLLSVIKGIGAVLDNKDEYKHILLTV